MTLLGPYETKIIFYRFEEYDHGLYSSIFFIFFWLWANKFDKVLNFRATNEWEIKNQKLFHLHVILRHLKFYCNRLSVRFPQNSSMTFHFSIWNWFPKSSCTIPNPNPLFPIYVCELQNSQNECSNDEKSPKKTWTLIIN